MLITNAILDPKDENFSKELSYEMLAEYHVGLRKQNYEDSYKAQWEADNPEKKTDYKTMGDYYTYKSKEIKYMQDVRDYNANPPPIDHFKHITASNPMSIAEVEITDKGSLGVIRERLLAGESFPIGDFIDVRPSKEGDENYQPGGWTMIKQDPKTGEVMENGIKTYPSTESFVKNGLNSTSPGFQNLKQYGEKEKIVLTDEEKEAGIKIYGDGNPYKLDEDDGLYYLYTR